MSICSAHQYEIDECSACQVTSEELYKELLVVTELDRTCYACPSIWEGKLANGQEFYIRFRHGDFRLVVDGNLTYSIHIDRMADGFLTNEEVLQIAPITLKCEITESC